MFEDNSDQLDNDSEATCHSAKKRRLSLESSAKHHPLFEYVETQGEFADIPTIHVLNDDCLETVLSWFNTVELFDLAQVCRRWYNLCFSKLSRLVHLDINKVTSWQSDFMFNRYPDSSWGYVFEKSKPLIKSIVALNIGSLTALTFTMEHFEFIETFRKVVLENLREICINWYDYHTIDEKISNFIKNNIGSNLRSLVLSTPSNSTQIPALKEIFSRAANLEHLCLSIDLDYEIQNFDVYLTPMVLPNTCPIKSFCIHNFPAIAQCQVLEKVIRNYSKTLEYLNLFPVLNLFPDLSESHVALNIPSPESLPMLLSMKIFSVVVSYPGPPYPNTPSHPLYNEKRQREFIRHQALLIKRFTTILKLMPNLKVLSLQSNGNVDFRGVDMIDMLAQHCPLLEELQLHDCWISTKNFAALKRLKFIKRLCMNFERIGFDLDGTIISHNHCELSIKAIASIISHLQKLEYLAVFHKYSNPDIDDYFQVLHRAGPNFKGLATGINDTYDSLVKCSSNKINDSDESYDSFDSRSSQDSYGSDHDSTEFKVTGRVNLIEEVIKKCKSLNVHRENRITVILLGLGGVHRTGCSEPLLNFPEEAGFGKEKCSCLDLHGLRPEDSPKTRYPVYYNEIAPKWLLIDYVPWYYSQNDIFDEHFALGRETNQKYLKRNVARRYMQIPNIKM